MIVEGRGLGLDLEEEGGGRGRRGALDCVERDRGVGDRDAGY